MTYFITHPSACRLYAKCYGWQETLAHFFVKTRRSSLAPLSPHHHMSSPDVLSADTKDQSLNASQESSNHTNRNQHRASTPIFVTLSPDDSSPMGNITDKLDLTQTYASSQHRLTPKSVSTSMDQLSSTKDPNGDFPSYPNEEIITPPQSASGSREDLLSLLKTESSNDNINDMTSNNSDLSSPLQRTTISTSKTQLYDDEEKHSRLGSALRNILGWPIALVCNKIKALG
jgi:hypothetical protein